MQLQLDQVSKTYHDGPASVEAVAGISLELNPREFIAVSGPSGCGKSTLLLMAGGLLAPDAGAVRLGNEDLYQAGSNRRAQLRNQQIGFVFQQLHLVPYLSVFDNVRSPSLVSRKQTNERARSLLENFGLTDRLDHLPANLSSGERQRAALARALLNEPGVLLADEPTGNLDAENSQAVLGHLKDFASAGGAVLLVTHDPLAAAAADRTITLRDGRIVE